MLILGQIKANDSIDFLELKTARALENIQELSREKNYEFNIRTSLKNEDELSISPQTNFIRKENIWAEAEFYLYGILKDAGGKNKANIHIDTVDYGYLSIETDSSILKEREENLLYKKIGIKAKGKQNIETGDIDTKSLHLTDIINYQPKFDKYYLDKLINKAGENLQKINTDQFLSEIRGTYEV